MTTYSNTRVTELVNEYVHSARDRAIMLDRFVDGLTFEALAERYDLSVRQVKRIIKKADSILLIL